MAKRSLTKRPVARTVAKPSQAPSYDSILRDMVILLESSRRYSARVVNSIMTATYWEIGRQIVQVQQRGQSRAEYGDALLKRLSSDLTGRFGRGFSVDQLQRFRSFFLCFSAAEPVEPPAKQASQKYATVSRKSAGEKYATPSRISKVRRTKPLHDLRLNELREIASRFPLPWSHYVRLLAVQNPRAREFYQTEALRSGWSVRQLERQIETQYYERTALSKNKLAMLRQGELALPADAVCADDEVRDPFLLEFLNLKDQYSESELEEALVHHLESFLLELGGDFTFVGRQRRLRIGDEWYRIDLLFFHRVLRCLVIIDLKLGRFTHADAGQMHLYLNYAKKHWCVAGENRPIGLILCTSKNEALAKYSLEGLNDGLLLREYRTALPKEELLADEIGRTRQKLETRRRQHR